MRGKDDEKDDVDDKESSRRGPTSSVGDGAAGVAVTVVGRE